MPTTSAPATTAEADPIISAPATCAVCPHPWDAHDSIGVRYCTASAAAGRQRGCVCDTTTSTAYRRH
jgi:hypothetical protein